MLHVLLREGGESTPILADGPLRLPNTFNDWCEWRDKNAEAATDTIIFSESQDDPTDMLIGVCGRQGLPTTRIWHPVGRRHEERVPTEETLAHVGCHRIQCCGF